MIDILLEVKIMKKIFLSFTYVLLTFSLVVLLTLLAFKKIINLTPVIGFSILFILFINISFFINNIYEEFQEL